MDINEIKTCKSIILFNEMLNNSRVFNTNLSMDDRVLENSFKELLDKKYIFINKGVYQVSPSGEEVFNIFMNRYNEYLKVYDIYSFVDTEKGEFAFEKFHELNDADWNVYKNNKRFYDVRIAVANFKKLNPTEIVFMSFINENRFDTSNSGWQLDLVSNMYWDEINNIVNTAITIELLGGNEIMENIVKKGSELMLNLIKKEIEIKKTELENVEVLAGETTEYITETTTIIEEYEDDLNYYDPYYDPYYVSAFWIVPLFLW